MLMLALEMIQWWYGLGWLRLIADVRGAIIRVNQVFSTAILLRTLGAPWRRIITYGGNSIADKFKAALDNLVSRMVGFAVRSLVLLTAVLSIVVIAVGGLILLVLWPLLPVLGIGLIVRGALKW